MLFQSNDYNNKLPPSENSVWKNKTELNNKQFETPIKNHSPLSCNSCCHLATKLLESFEEKTPIFHQLDSNEDPKINTSMNYHDNSKCYCTMFAANK